MAIICIINDIANFLIQLEVTNLTKLDLTEEISFFELLYSFKQHRNGNAGAHQFTTSSVCIMFMRKYRMNLPLSAFIAFWVK